MTLRPIQGAPIDAPIPDFPTGEPNPLVMPASQYRRRSDEPSTFSDPPPTHSPGPLRRPGPISIRGTGNIALTFRCIPEIPAINRSSMTISITGEATGEYSPRLMPHVELATDEAKAFLQALCNRRPAAVIADRRSGVRVEFAVTEEGPEFAVSKPDQERSLRRFNAGWSFDLMAMAANLLADLGP
jgi:hypothetical protein